MGTFNLQNRRPNSAVTAFSNAYQFSKKNPEQAMQFNQRVTDLYLGQKDFPKAIETKKDILSQGFVQNSTQLQAHEIASLADIYIQKKEDSTAINSLRESYSISVKNGHTLEARASIERLDSIYQSMGRPQMSLQLYKDFLVQLPVIIDKDSSLTDDRIIAQTETKIKELEMEKALKDDLIRRKNVFNYWLIGSVIILLLFTGFVLYILRKLRIKNKKIALQSLRREMNPHFIFNSLNSINQFISTNNELAANQYLTKFSTLMRRVMENSKEDFVLFSKEIELLQNYLELERSRFPDKFDFDIKIDDSLYADEHLYMPGMLVQPHLENAIWHGLRYMDEKGFLQLSFTKAGKGMEIIIEDNGIGMAESKKSKTENQKKHSGRGITNTLEQCRR
jgi:tetratricopeptide (TPR) repeat protein